MKGNENNTEKKNTPVKTDLLRNIPDQTEGKYITLQDIRFGFEDFVGLRNVIKFIFLASLIILTLYFGTSTAAIKIKPLCRAHVLRARAYAAQKQNDKALSDFRRAVVG